MELMRRSLLCTLVLELSPFVLFANQPIVRTIHFSGNYVFNDREIASCMATVAGSHVSAQQLADDRASVVRLYHRRGYYFAVVAIEQKVPDFDSTLVDIIVDIHEGTSYTIGSIECEGNSHYPSEQLLKNFETHVGGFLEASLLERDIGTLLAWYGNNGYPFATVSISSIRTSEDSTQHALVLYLKIEEGARVTIDEIRVTGNRETKTDVIVRETRFPLHETFNEEKVSAVSDRLKRMGIFSSVQEPQVYTGENGGGLLLSVAEGNANTFDGILGYVPSPGTDGGGTVSGMVNVTFGNLFGTARKLNVQWQRDDAQSQEITLRYLEPWLFNLPLTLGGMFHQRQQDSLYVRRDVELKADLYATEYLSVGGIFEFEAVIPSASVFAQSLSNSQTTTGGAVLRYDTRDDALSPTRGVDYRTRYQIGTKKSTALLLGSANENVSVQKLSIDVDGYVQTLERQVLAVGLHGRQTISGRLELGDLYRIGGANTLRGYRENVFIGSRVAWMNTEYRFLLERRSFFYGFTDLGYVTLPADELRHTAEEKLFKAGYGIGIRLETALGNVGVSFALGQADSFTQGKIHFGLINQF